MNGDSFFRNNASFGAISMVNSKAAANCNNFEGIKQGYVIIGYKSNEVRQQCSGAGAIHLFDSKIKP
jgi:hypothetical protein